MLAARTQGLITDFLLIFLIRWALKFAGLQYIHLSSVVPRDWWAINPDTTFATMLYGGMYFVSGLPELIFAGMWMIYAIICLMLCGQTVGMRTVGVRLVDVRGMKPSLLRIVLRQLISPISAVFWIGYLVAWIAPKAATLHDLIAGTHPEYANLKPMIDDYSETSSH